MAPLRSLAALFLGASAVSGFAPATTPFAARNVASSRATELNVFDGVFNDAMKEWNEDHPQLAEFGWGPSVQAEKWNGRHAMFGWVVICATAYAKGHGLIPNADAPLDLKEWGTLATISGKNTITNERAIILIANVHAFSVGLLATLCPLPFSDPLLVDPDSDVPTPEPFGYLPEFLPGVTEEAEIYNGRLAMLGLSTLVGASAIQGKPMLDIVNECTGHAYY
uniref:Uncharacterized protein n=1 Tax=Ditylum brightwellii TaxID=49249 RepID=A0A7S4QGI0_9STRA